MKRALLAAALTLALIACDDTSNPPSSPPASGGAGSAKFDQQQAQQELDALQSRFSDALDQQQDLRPIVDEARRYVERYPKVAAGHVMLGQINLLRGDSEAASQQFELALDIDPKQPEVRLSAGTAALNAGDLDRAEKHFSQAVGLDTSNPRHRMHLAAVYLHKNQFDKAELTLLEALKLDSSYHQAHALLADVYAKQNRPDMAIGQLDRAIALAGDDRHRGGYLRRKAQLQLRANRPAEALRTLNELPKKMLIDPEVSQQLAACWMMMGQPGRAADHYEHLAAINPTDADLLAEAARWMIKADRPDDARRMLERLRLVSPRHEAIAQLESQLDAAPQAAAGGE